MLKKTTFREIKQSLGRYLAILSIVALGVGFFSGLKVTREAMVDTANAYISSNRLFDFRVISTLGFEQEDVDALQALDNVEFAEGSVSIDALFDIDDQSNIVLMTHSLTNKINQIQLSSGRMPEKDNEFIGDNRYFSPDDIGKKITLSKSNDDDKLDSFKEDTFVLTGIAESPYYLNFERGSSSLGNGTVSGFIYLKPEAYDIDYSTEIFLSMYAQYEVYSEEYSDLIKNAEEDIKASTKEVALARYNRIVKSAKEELRRGQEEYDYNYNKYEWGKETVAKELIETKHKLEDADLQISNAEAELATTRETLEAGQAELDAGFAQYEEKLAEFEASKEFMTDEQIAQAEEALAATYATLTDKQAEIAAGLQQVAAGEEELLKNKDELEQNKNKYKEALKTAPEQFREAEAQLSEAQAELDDAQAKIDEIAEPETFVLDRNTNIGYACFENDSNIVDGIAKVFPIFFFMVAALVCMTTMTRMIDEQRTQIGVFKALGYSNKAIMSKYLFYSGSAAIIGCIIGYLGGCYIFPRVIWAAYQMMYDFNPNLNYVLNLPLALISLVVSLLCSVGATIASCYHEFKEVPAQLIRPKSPKEGKRILLERIDFIWNKISFLYKVSFRNVFRYKKRFLMMVLGISGCTALLVTGFGIKDSIKNIVDFQYDNIQVYDYSVNFNDPLSEEDQNKFIEDTEDHVDEVTFLHHGTTEMLVGKKVKDVHIVSTDSDVENFDHFVKLEDDEENPISYPKKGEIVICNKLSKDNNIKMGDEVTLRDSNMKEMTLKVSGICKNYVYNYVYVSNDSCLDALGYEPEVKSAFVNVNSDDIDDIYSSSAQSMNESNVTAVSVNNDFRNRVDNMMRSLDYVIILVIVAAGALAFIVLYNLTNINITERIREIATIKVLGFYPNETAAYVFRENIFLTAISAIVGLFAGKWLHAFVMSQINIDMIYFDVVVLPISYLLAVGLTFVFAIVVNFAMYFKLGKINMTESLKSIE